MGRHGPTNRGLRLPPGSKSGAPDCLAGSSGVLQVDGYAGHKVLAERGKCSLPSAGGMSVGTFANSP
jgi:hypothetical protein